MKETLKVVFTMLPVVLVTIGISTNSWYSEFLWMSSIGFQIGWLLRPLIESIDYTEERK